MRALRRRSWIVKRAPPVEGIDKREGGVRDAMKSSALERALRRAVRNLRLCAKGVDVVATSRPVDDCNERFRHDSTILKRLFHIIRKLRFSLDRFAFETKRADEKTFRAPNDGPERSPNTLGVVIFFPNVVEPLESGLNFFRRRPRRGDEPLIARKAHAIPEKEL